MRSRGKNAMPRLFVAGATLLAALGVLLITPGSATHGGTHTSIELIAGAGSTTSAVWDESLTSDDFVRAVGISPDGSTVVAIGDRFDAAFGSNDLLVVAFDAALGGAPLWTNLFDGPAVGFEDNARSLEFSPDSSTVYVAFASENVVGVNVSQQTSAIAYVVATGALAAGWAGAVSYPAFGGFSREMPYGSCIQDDGLQLFIVGQTVSSLAIDNPPAGPGAEDYVSGAAQMNIVAVDTSDGSQVWGNAYITTGNVADNSGTLAIGFQPGYADCECTNSDAFVLVGASDVNRFGDGDDRSPGLIQFRTDGVITAGVDDPSNNTFNSFSGTERAVQSLSVDENTDFVDGSYATVTLGARVMAGASTDAGFMTLDWDTTQPGSAFHFFSTFTFGRTGEGHNVLVASGDDAALPGTGSRAYVVGTRRTLATDPQTSRLSRISCTGIDFGVTVNAVLWPVSLDFGGDSLTEPDWSIAARSAPAVFPLSGERLYILRAEQIDGASANNFDGAVDHVDSSLVSATARIVAGSLEDAAFNSGQVTSNSLFDGVDTPSDENKRFSSPASGILETFTRADYEHDLPSQGLLDINTQFTGPTPTSQKIAVGVTEYGSSRFTVILYEPDVPVPATVTVTDPSGTPPVPIVDDTSTAYVGLNADVLVALGDFPLGFDPVQTPEEAVYIGRDGVRELLLSGGPGAGTYNGTWRSSRNNTTPALIPAACAATEGLHSLDGEAVDASALSGFGSLAVDVDNMLFTDVDCLHFAFLFINACKRAGISAGFPDGSYHPGDLVNRASMSVFTARVVSYNKVGDQTDFTAFVPPACVTPGVPPATFSDVPCAYFAYKHIYYLIANSVAAGTTATTYGPTLLLRRNAMAVFMAKAKDFGDNEAPTLAAFVPPICGSESFPDVGCVATFYKEIEYIKAHLITSGFGDGTYRPTALVDRAAMSVMLIRTTGDESDQLPFPVVAF